MNKEKQTDETMRKIRREMLRAVDELTTIYNQLRCRHINLHTLEAMLLHTYEPTSMCEGVTDYCTMAVSDIDGLLDRLQKAIQNLDNIRRGCK